MVFANTAKPATAASVDRLQDDQLGGSIDPANNSSQSISQGILIAEWWRNRKGEAIRVRLSSYQDVPLVDVRTWYNGDDGVLKPGKGFAAHVKHLPRLSKEIKRALVKARELGLVKSEDQ